jgi:hypothetical protein
VGRLAFYNGEGALLVEFQGKDPGVKETLYLSPTQQLVGINQTTTEDESKITSIQFTMLDKAYLP